MGFRHLAAFLLGGILFLAGCEDAAKSTSDAAIKATEEAFNAAKTEANKYVPDQVKAVSDSIDQAKAAFGKQDYQAVISATKDITAKIQELGPAAVKAKDELAPAWKNISATIPRLLDSAAARVKALTAQHKLPEGASEKFDAIKKGWAESLESFKTGYLADATTKAIAVKNQLMELAISLGMKPPEPAK